jgi:hypothetical protein
MIDDDLRERADRVEGAVTGPEGGPLIAFERPDGILLDGPDGDRLTPGDDPVIILPADLWGER